MTFSDGDFLKVDYTLWRIADNKVLFTTQRELAKKEGIEDEKANYSPHLMIVGKGNLVKGLDNAIRGMAVNEQKKIELEPSVAFGERRADLVSVIPISRFRSRDIEPYPGMTVELDGVSAMVKSVNSGRVLVDANHMLAGEKVAYEVKILEKIEKDDAKISALADEAKVKLTSVKVDSSKATISIGKDVNKDAKYAVDKTMLIDSVLEYMPSIKSIEVNEEYAREEPKKEAKKEESEAKTESK